MALILKRLFIFFSSSKFLGERTTLLSEISKSKSDILTCTDSEIVETLMLGDTLFTQFDNKRILNATITFTVSLERFNDTLFYSDQGARKWTTGNVSREF